MELSLGWINVSGLSMGTMKKRACVSSVEMGPDDNRRGRQNSEVWKEGVAGWWDGGMAEGQDKRCTRTSEGADMREGRRERC